MVTDISSDIAEAIKDCHDGITIDVKVQFQ